MNPSHLKRLFTAGWILVWAVFCLAVEIEPLGAAVLVVACALAPPLLVLLRWNDPPQTLSESIQEARR